MEYKGLRAVFCSPTHTTKKVVTAFVSAFDREKSTEITDLTCDRSTGVIEVSPDCLAVVAAPVYAGRVAPFALERLKRLKGDGTPAVLIVVYGNRDYEDALIELHDTLTERGFVTVAAAAFVGEHSYSRTGMPIAEGRPDESDIADAVSFGIRTAERLSTAPTAETIKITHIPGKHPYREVGTPTPAAPDTLENCVGCGYCAEICPTAAIEMREDNGSDHPLPYTDKNKCIKCCACVKLCPSSARRFDTPYTAMLHEKFSARRANETFEK